jgi:excisionase family DNA binding protein
VKGDSPSAPSRSERLEHFVGSDLSRKPQISGCKGQSRERTLKPRNRIAVSIVDLSRTYLTTHQVARLVGASPSTVLSWVDRGWLPAHRTPGGHRRIEKQALVEFLRAHDMPELGSDAEPTKLLLLMPASPDSKQLIESLKQRLPDLRVDHAEGVVSGLAHLLEAPPDVLLIDATMPGVDAAVICRELASLSVASRLRVIVVRPPPMSSGDEGLREAGVWTILDAPVATDEVFDSLAVGNLDATRPKAS